jgi:hypothetical protein
MLCVNSEEAALVGRLFLLEEGELTTEERITLLTT